MSGEILGVLKEFVLAFSVMVICAEALLFIFKRTVSFNFQYQFRKTVPYVSAIIVLLSRLYEKALPQTFLSDVVFPVVSVGQTHHLSVDMKAWIFAIYMVITAVFMLNYLIRFMIFSHKIQKGKDISDSYAKELSGRKISVYSSSECKSPFCYGIINKVIAFPVEYEDNTCYAIRHEIAHCDNHDPAVLIGAKFLALIMWFNPIAHIYYQKVRVSCEYASHERMNKDQAFEEKKQYMRTVLASTPRQAPVIYGAAFSAEKTLKQRFSNILINSKKSSKRSVILIAGAVILIAAAVILATSFMPEKMIKTVKVNYAPGKEVARSVEYEEYTDDKWFRGELPIASTEDAGYGITCATYTGTLYEWDRY